MNNLLNVVMRLHSAAKLREFSTALFSVYAQHYQPVQPIVVVQTFSAAQMRALEETVCKFNWQAPRRPPMLHNVQVPQGDYRSKLLNEGVKLCQGRFLAFLDYDDVLYRHAYAYLVGRLHSTGAALAFGRVYRKDVVPGPAFDYHFDRSGPFLGRNRMDLFRGNFCPLHSYVLDRGQIPADELWFDEGLTRLEDYDLLLRLCTHHRADFEGLDKFVGEYIVRSDGSNTLLSQYAADPDNLRQWEMARRHVQKTKARLQPQWTVGEMLRMMPSA